MSIEIFIPYAVFCNSFHKEADGSVTIERIINRVTCVKKRGGKLRRTESLPVLHVQYAVCFNSARPVTGLKIGLRCTRPSGKQVMCGSKILDLAGEYKGTFLASTLDILPTEHGWHIFDVLVEGSPKTCIPLHLSVVHERGEAQVPEMAGRAVAALRKALSHRSCYARRLGGCSSKISREHYLSENILKELNEAGGLWVGGLPWLKSGSSIAI